MNKPVRGYWMDDEQCAYYEADPITEMPFVGMVDFQPVTILPHSDDKDDGWPMVGEFAEWMIEVMHQLAAEALTSVEREAYDEIAAAIAGLFEGDRS